MFSIGQQTGIVRLEEDLDYDDPATREHTITIVASVILAPYRLHFNDSSYLHYYLSVIHDCSLAFWNWVLMKCRIYAMPLTHTHTHMYTHCTQNTTDIYIYLCHHTQDHSSDMSLSDAEPLTIAVSDINDRNPVFSATSYSVSVYENLTYVSLYSRHL